MPGSAGHLLGSDLTCKKKDLTPWVHVTPWVHEEVRELIHQSYRIAYWIVVDRIQILAVIHDTRDLESIERKPWDVDS